MRAPLVVGLIVLAAAGATASAAAGQGGCALSPRYSTIRLGPDSDIGDLPFDATAGCPRYMPASSTDAWLTINSAYVAEGGGLVAFRVPTNTTGASRSATVVVNGQALFSVTQGTANCVSSVMPAAHAFASGGGSVVFSVQTSTPDCFWRVSGFPPAPTGVHPNSTGWAFHTGVNSFGLPGAGAPYDIGSRSFEVTAYSNAANATARSATLVLAEVFRAGAHPQRSARMRPPASSPSRPRQSPYRPTGAA